MHFDLTEIIKAVGYVGLFIIVFAESGLLIGFFLPGDSLLFTAGFLASQGFFDIRILVPLFLVAAITGDSVGYSFGYRVGRRLFERPDSRWFKQQYLLETEKFYEKHGGKTIILARFIPIIRTFAPIIAGVARMEYRRFLLFNMVGGVLWGAGVPIAGYILGSVVPDVDRYIIPIVLAIIIVSVVPNVYHVVKLHRKELVDWIRRGRARQ